MIKMPDSQLFIGLSKTMQRTRPIISSPDPSIIHTVFGYYDDDDE